MVDADSDVQYELPSGVIEEMLTKGEGVKIKGVDYQVVDTGEWNAIHTIIGKKSLDVFQLKKVYVRKKAEPHAINIAK